MKGYGLLPAWLPKLWSAVLLLGALGWAAVTPAQAPDGAGWQRYGNARYGFSVCYPGALLKPRGEPDNSDGNTFTSADGQVTVLAWAQWDMARDEGKQPMDALRAMALEDLASQHAKLEYSVVRPTFVVVSGTAHAGTPGATVYYRKSVLVGDRDVSLSFTYPVRLKPVMDPVVQRMTTCLQNRDGKPIG